METTVTKHRGERGLGRTTMVMVGTAIEILQEQNPMTVRGVAYQLFNRKIIPDMGRSHTSRVSRVLVSARERDLIPWTWIVDETRPIEQRPQWGDIDAYSHAVVRSYRRDYWETSDTKIVVVSEKSTVGGVLRPVIDEYGVSFLSVHGFNSATKVYELAQASVEDHRTMWLLYVGDYDPSGLFMSEVDLPKRLNTYGGLVAMRRIALDSADLHGLPTFTADEKTQDPRHDWFVANHGRICAELDAMNANELRQRVRDAIEKFVDPDVWERHKLTERAEIETIKTVFSRMVSA
jgi:hypothetical protein